MFASVRRTISAFATTAVLFTAACDSTENRTVTDPAYTPVATAVQIGELGVIRDGDVRQLSAIVRDQKGRELPGASVQFTSTDPTVAVVGAGNLLTALREGVTELVAVSGPAQQRVLLNVQLHPATAIEVNITALAMLANEQRTVQATLRGLDNRVLHNRTLTWQSSNANVARVDAQGRITAVAPGTARVTVQYGTLNRVISIDVGGYAAAYTVATVNGRALPTNVFEEIVTRDDGSTYTLIERLEAGTVTFGDRYGIALTIADIERQTFQGNVIERVMRRRQIQDEGIVEYNWLDGRARLLSAKVGNLTHAMIPDGPGHRLDFRIGGTNTIWSLALRSAR
jgi:hypothetical protein